MRYRISFLFFCFLFIGTIVPQCSCPFHHLPLYRQEDVGTTSSYQEHEPITIISNSDFDNQGWPGEGTREKPYLIKGLNITSSSDCISIYDTTAEFRIEDCIITYNGTSSSNGIFFDNVENGKVVDCVVQNHSYGIYLSRSRNCTLHSNNAISMLNTGVVLLDSPNCSLIDNNVTNCSGYCYNIAASNDCIIENNSAISCPCGFIISSSNRTLLTKNVVHSTDTGYYIVESEYINVTRNVVLGDADGIGIYCSRANHCKVFSNTVNNESTGISATEVVGFQFKNNTVIDCEHFGFEIKESVSCLFENNTAKNNGWHGIRLFSCNSCVVVKNNLLSNAIGIFLWSICTNNTVYLNRLGFNANSNAYDNGFLNSWDNGIYGNCWGDYSGSGSYTIDGTAEALDTIPILLNSSRPWISEPEDVEYIQGDSGSHINWYLYDYHPKNYSVYKDGFVQSTGVWNSIDHSVSVNVDGNQCGEYNYTIVAENMNGNEQTDYVNVRVFETVSPTIDSPEDVAYQESTTGNQIVWNASDTHPEYYIVYRNSSELVRDDWNGLEITINVDNLTIGAYNYTVVVFDTSGNSISDTVWVTVYDSIQPSIDHPDDISYEVGSTGYSITWSPSDLNPESYEIYRNGSRVVSDTWDGGNISIGVDGLEIGHYNYTILVYDTAGNSAYDFVFVFVEPQIDDTNTTTSSTTTTANPNNSSGTLTTNTLIGIETLWILPVISGIFVVFVVTLFIRKH